MSKLLFNMIVSISKSHLIPCSVRKVMLKAAGLKIGENTVICSNMDITNKNIKIGKNVLINKNCHIYPPKNNCSIIIGDNVKIAFDVTIAAATHVIGDHDKRCGESQYRNIVIGDGSWIGMRSTILSGVTIGKGCVIGAGALVNKDCEDDGLYVGVPARLIRRLD